MRKNIPLTTLLPLHALIIVYNLLLLPVLLFCRFFNAKSDGLRVRRPSFYLAPFCVILDRLISLSGSWCIVAMELRIR